MVDFIKYAVFQNMMQGYYDYFENYVYNYVDFDLTYLFELYVDIIFVHFIHFILHDIQLVF